MSELVLNIDGERYAGWKEIDVTISMENLSGNFTVGVTDNVNSGTNKPINSAVKIKPGKTCQVLINNKVVITGYIDKVTLLIDAHAHNILIQGRDKTGDLCDCSMIQSTNQWKNLTAKEIITRICNPFSISVKSNVDDGKPIDSFVVEQGTSCFETIQKLCYMRQLLAISDGKGGLLLTRAGTEKTNTSVVEGVNLLTGQAEYDEAERFSLYMCRGQRQGDDFTTPESVSNNSGQFEDSSITRYRPLLIIAEGQASSENCTLRAKWEASIRAGKSKRFNISVNGWNQSNGDLWTTNKLISLQSSRLGVNENLLISEVNFRLDGEGEITNLKVTSPNAFTVDPSGTSNSSATQLNPYMPG